MRTLNAELVLENEIRRRRTQAARSGMIATVAQAQILFWCWALGWTLGPAPMRPVELGAGALFTFGLGVALSWPFVRKRMEHGRQWSLPLTEGGRKRRVSGFERHLMIGEDIVVRSALREVEAIGAEVRIVYERPQDGERLERRLGGEARDLSRLVTELSPPAAEPAAPPDAEVAPAASEPTAEAEREATPGDAPTGEATETDRESAG
jgi:hypothetical protein